MRTIHWTTPEQNPLTSDVLAFNASFQQIYEMFNKLEEKLNIEPQFHDQTRIPNIVNVVNEIRRIRSSFRIGKLFESNVILWLTIIRIYLRSGNLPGTH